MRRAQRGAAVAALVLLIPLTPLLISLSAEEPGAERKEPREARREGSEEFRGRGTAEVRLLGVKDLHGYLERTGESPGAA